MKIAMIGTGYVGLVSGVCFSAAGHDVICVDKVKEKIAQLLDGEMPIYEPGLEELVRKSRSSGKLSFETNLTQAVATADVVFIAVGTPSRESDGHADLKQVFGAAKEIAQSLDGPTVVVTKSTVPVGTWRDVERIIKENRPDAEFDIVSNPEFLREGKAIKDFQKPDRVVVGCQGDRAKEVMRELYGPFDLCERCPEETERAARGILMFTTLEAAELIKYASNALLATKITFINEIADLCEAVGANVEDVAKGIGLDDRIGPKFLLAGPGYGGSCFPKDTLALLRTAEVNNVEQRVVEAVVHANDRRKRTMANRVVAACGGSVRDKTIALLGLTFKPETDDMRDSPAINITFGLQDRGAKIRAFDPKGEPKAREVLQDVTYCSDAYDAMDGADALVIVTEWDEFRGLDLDCVKSLLRQPVFVDLRNLYDPDDMAKAGFSYHSVGRG